MGLHRGLYSNQEAWTQGLALEGVLAPLGNCELLPGLYWILDPLILLLCASAMDKSSNQGTSKMTQQKSTEKDRRREPT